jgi:ferredoxin--NADP+ reductase
MDVYAPRVAKSAQPGQFVIVRSHSDSERVPLTICDYDREQELVTIVFQAVGASTIEMASLEVGDGFADFSGPLGNATELLATPLEELKQTHILFVAGGVGAAPVYPQVKWAKSVGLDVDVVIGARNKELILFEDEMSQYAANVYVTTDDGSYGYTGNVNDRIKELIDVQNKHYDLIVAIGPLVMMKFVCIMTKTYDIKTVVSMNPIMIDGTGMCGACRLSVGGQMKFACVDGPEFDGHDIDFNEAISRSRMYTDQEKCKV